MRRDDEDLREFYAAARWRLVVQLTALTADVAEAEDVVQEAFARAVRRWSKVRDYDNPEAWLHTVAVNIARSRWRRAQRGLRARLQVGRPAAAPELSPDHVALLTGLRALPAEQATAIVLHHLVDLPVDEVAARTGVPAGTVKARLARGRAALAVLLGDRAAAEKEVRRSG